MRPASPRARFLLAFPLLLVAFTLLLGLPPIDEGLVTPFNHLLAWLSGNLLSLWDPDIGVHGNIIAAPEEAGVAILTGCNGIEAIGILAAAMLAYPAPPGRRLLGVLLGTLAIQVLNLARILSLYALNRWQPDWFDTAHRLWPTLIILDALAIFFLWIRYNGNHPRGAS